MKLDDYIRQRLESRSILLMTHIVLGYPSLAASKEIVAAMERGGADLVELQIPFSEPIADGPVILKANQSALKAGVTVESSLQCAAEILKTTSIPALIMTYYNVIFKYGHAQFVDKLLEIGAAGAIVPDLPVDQAGELWELFNARGLSFIVLVAPTTPIERMKLLASYSQGLVYCVARKGVTGSDTNINSAFEEYLGACRSAFDVPVAVGFGIKERRDVEALIGRADVAVVGSQMIRIIDEAGVQAVQGFVERLCA